MNTDFEDKLITKEKQEEGMPAEFQGTEDNSKSEDGGTDMGQDKQKFKFETLGGDASLLHLAQQIDRGIKRKRNQIEDEDAKWWRKIHNTFFPLRSLSLIIYIS